MSIKWFDRIAIATHNPGKLAEISDLLADYTNECVSIAQYSAAVPEETGSTFIENARIKAHAGFGVSGLPTLGDDSGLVIDAMGGHPGIYSARWARSEDGNQDYRQAMARILKELDGRADRSACFVSALAMVLPDGIEIEAEGRVYGEIAYEMRGQNGFGYDPIFLKDGRTFAEMAAAEKYAIDHRAHAFRRLLEKFPPVITDSPEFSIG